MYIYVYIYRERDMIFLRSSLVNILLHVCVNEEECVVVCERETERERERQRDWPISIYMCA